MPITRRQFELEIDTEIEEWMSKISHFLLEHKDVAFSRDELWKALLPKGGEWKACEAALDKLVDMRAAGKRIIRDTEYYAFEEQTPF